MEALAGSALDLMCDFETLATDANAALLSMGLVVFNRYTGEIKREDYHEFSLQHEIFNGRLVDPSTVAWWKKVNPSEFRRLLQGTAYSGYCIRSRMEEILEDYDVKYVWSRGSMDFQILERRMVKKLPYYMHRDVRTLDIFGIRMGSNKHHALEDCRGQIKYVSEVLQRCNVRSVERSLEVMDIAPHASGAATPSS